jgi:hypothetical protein
MHHQHTLDHWGPDVPLRYGSAKTQVCECGAWRMVTHYGGVRPRWGWRTDSIEDAVEMNDD